MAGYSFSHSNKIKKIRLAWSVSRSLEAPNTDGLAGSFIPPVSRPWSSNQMSGKNAFRISTSLHTIARPASLAAERSLRLTLQPETPSKRVLDIVLASTLLIVLAPFLLILAMLVRLSGPGPVIFRQKRIGAHRKPFVLLKFRTMGQSPQFTQATLNDPRVTAIGRILRRLSFDEFVQLVNVIKGEMSLVGPRPHAPETRVEGILFEEAVLSYRDRYAAKPGITGLAQIRGQRGETRTIQHLEDRIASDIEYIENWSIWLDLSILLKTIPAILKQVNAY